MEKTLLVIISLLGACLFATYSIAGPFGLSKGMTLEQIDKDAQQMKPGTFATEKLPTPHSSFAGYFLVIGPKFGLCKIQAIGESLTTNSFGDQLKSEFEEMSGRLEKLYGKGEVKDFLKSGSIWNEPQDFMMGLRKKERVLAAIWETKNGSELTDDLEVIVLSAKAWKGDRDKGFLMLEYEFNGMDSCIDEIRKSEDSAL